MIFTRKTVYIPHHVANRSDIVTNPSFSSQWPILKDPGIRTPRNKTNQAQEAKYLNRFMLLCFPSIFCRLVKTNTKKPRWICQRIYTGQIGIKCFQCFRTEHFQVHSSIQYLMLLNTELSTKTKGNNYFNSFYQTPHHVFALAPNPGQTSLFIFLYFWEVLAICRNMLWLPLCKEMPLPTALDCDS